MYKWFVELHHLRYFITLAEELNFSRAAERLNVSQPHLTRLIAQIEKFLGVKLLNRTTRQVTLTTAGEVFLVEAQIILARLEQAIKTVRQVNTNEHGRIGLGFTEMVLHSILPKILGVFYDSFPKVEIETLEACTEQQVEALQSRKIDIGFLHPPLRADFLHLLPIYKEELMIALSVNHPLAQQPQVSLKELANDKFILHPREDGPVLYDHILNLCKQAKFTPKILHKTANQTFIGLITAQIGVCFMAPSMQNAKNPSVVFLPIEGTAPTLEYALAWRKDNSSPCVSAFLNMVEELLPVIQEG